ncbi:MAG: UDP-N-acetylmuramoyl-tripeptide--D-alanyl-D-alanine ligase [Eubacteriales bacterium]|nr:UDP-N-acetylmuramoyl-tripeptide--D-alanyl-D-alanine ligase [Eubacteriales bacterium]
MLIVAVISLVICAAAVALYSQPLVHLLQLESYQLPQFFAHLKKEQKGLLIQPWWLFAIAAALQALTLLRVYPGQELPWMQYGGVIVRALLFTAVLTVAYLAWRKRPKKKPLVYTARVKRLLAMLGLVLLALAAWFVLVFWLLTRYLPVNELVKNLVMMAFQLIFAVCAPQWLRAAALAVQPLEKAIARRYFNEAKKKLAKRKELIKIGITGSYGKTSVKMILQAILAEKYKTYATPHSYNTPMGVTRVVRSELEDSYEVFIAEMGARHLGDIAEMCDLVGPNFGILTSVGPQHLETFGSLENVAAGKYELVENMDPNGMVFFPADGGICEALYARTNMSKGLFGTQEKPESLVWVSELTAGPQGSSFLLHHRQGGQVACTTRLLGKHNVMNIAGCAALAYRLGLTMEQIATGIAKAEPVEHRLQLLPTGNGVAVIDDAFNSNPAGTRAALEVLSTFPGRKIVVTPGLVELGEKEEEENRAFGEAMAKVADLAILVAGNGPAIREGLLAGGFDKDNIILTGKLSEASAALGTLTRAGDAVLFENDLPDHYEN